MWVDLISLAQLSCCLMTWRSGCPCALSFMAAPCPSRMNVLQESRHREVPAGGAERVCRTTDAAGGCCFGFSLG